MDEKILFIDDDAECRELVEKILSLEGYEILLAPDGPTGLHRAYEEHPDLILLDVAMPGEDGFDVCSNLRKITDVPIIMLSARTNSHDIQRGFAVGADDYVKKPFVRNELVSRVRALLRRTKVLDSKNNGSSITSYTDGVLDIDLPTFICKRQGEAIALTKTEFDLLATLVRHPNKTLSTKTLLQDVWGDAYSHDKGILSLYIHQLRQKLNDGESGHRYIRTEWGRGYCFDPRPYPEQKIIVDRPKQGDKETLPSRSAASKWILLTLGLTLIFLALGGRLQAAVALLSQKSTTLEAMMTTEGFWEDGLPGVRGDICVTNTGNHPTEDLSIVDSVQVIGKGQGNYISTAVDIRGKPVLKPGESHCYPYRVLFGDISGSDVKYKNVASVTITDYKGLMPGTDHCPGSDKCAFGPNLVTEFEMPRP